MIDFQVFLFLFLVFFFCRSFVENELLAELLSSDDRRNGSVGEPSVPRTSSAADVTVNGTSTSETDGGVHDVQEEEFHQASSHGELQNQGT